MPNKGIKYIHYIGKKEADEYESILLKFTQLLNVKSPNNCFRIGFDYNTCESIIEQNNPYRELKIVIGSKSTSKDGKTKSIMWGGRFWWTFKFERNVNDLLKKFQIKKHDEFVVYHKAKIIEINKILSNEAYENVHSNVILKRKVPQKYFAQQKFYIVALTDNQYKSYSNILQPFVFLAGRTTSYSDKVLNISKNKGLISMKLD